VGKKSYDIQYRPIFNGWRISSKFTYLHYVGYNLVLIFYKINYTPEAFRLKLIQWIVCDDQPFTVAEGTDLRFLFKMLNPNVQVPTADTIRAGILSIFSEEQDRMRQKLQETPGKISFTLDAWTSRNQLPFLGITAHWIDSNWNLCSTLIDFRLLLGPHSGENLKAAFEESCRMLGIMTKVCFIYCIFGCSIP
jgi:hypothetical protein